jgi:hypothetical protein
MVLNAKLTHLDLYSYDHILKCSIALLRNLPSRRHLRRLDLSSLALTIVLYSRLALKFWREVALFILIFPPLSCPHDQYLKVNRRVFNHAVSFTMLISSLLFLLPYLVYFYILKIFLKKKLLF